MRHPRWIAASAIGAVVLGTLAAIVPPATAATADTLSVDFATPTGDFRGGASGTLYGLGDEGAPTQALTNGAHLTNTSQKAPYGTQHPSGDALKVENGFFAKNGTQLDIYVQDYYPDWAYNGGKRPGDDRTYNQADGSYTNQPNGIWDYLEVVEFVTEAVATKSAHPDKYVFIPFNVPDGGNWYADNTVFTQQFLPDWKAAVEKIRAVYARHGLGDPVIGGPGDASWRADRTATWLDYAKTEPEKSQAVKVAAETDDVSESALVVRQGSDDLVAAIDEALDELRADGTLAAISDEYFGQDVSR